MARDLNAEAKQHEERIMKLYRTAIASPEGYQSVMKIIGTHSVRTSIAPFAACLDRARVLGEIAHWALGDLWTWKVRGTSPAFLGGGVVDAEFDIVIERYRGERFWIELDLDRHEKDVDWLRAKFLEGGKLLEADLRRFGHYCNAVIMSERLEVGDRNSAVFELQEVA
jgi:hypothetical protein